MNAKKEIILLFGYCLGIIIICVKEANWDIGNLSETNIFMMIIILLIPIWFWLAKKDLNKPCKFNRRNMLFSIFGLCVSIMIIIGGLLINGSTSIAMIIIGTAWMPRDAIRIFNIVQFKKGVDGQ